MLVIFLASGIMSAYLLMRPKSGIAEIISDGKVLYTIDLGTAEDRLITVEYEGRKNVIAIESGDICMKEAQCPDHTCIGMGRLSEAGVPIVCLPNHLMIRYKDREGDDIDAAAK